MCPWDADFGHWEGWGSVLGVEAGVGVLGSEPEWVPEWEPEVGHGKKHKYYT